MGNVDFWKSISFVEKNVIFSLKGKNKEGVLGELLKNVLSCHTLDISYKTILDNFLSREKKGSTGMLRGIAVPHLCLDYCGKFLMAVGVHREGVDFESLDNGLTYFILLTLVPKNMTNFHLVFLSRFSKFLFRCDTQSSILSLSNEKALYDMIREKI